MDDEKIVETWMNRAKFGGRNRLHGPDPYNGSAANTMPRAELARRRCSAHNSDNKSRPTKKKRKGNNHAFIP
ncbi:MULTISPECIES: hypothetical protein [Bradyrhizobium]|uniref:hypothetical protein n=1 Tax=Bradyrhizobium elkanii TaxID=29448 RepID=UPI0018AD3A88|nr:hypothetical protein [Bradyrhizobium elkanii]